MRIDELAKKFNCSGRELDEVLSGLGVSIANEGFIEDKVYTQIVKELEKKRASKKTIMLKAVKLGDLADKLDISASSLIMFLLKKGYAFNKNQFISEDVLKVLSEEFGFSLEKHSVEEKSLALDELKNLDNLETRPPIIVVIGHVDHGKTTLLDYIRSSRVAAKEKGGITQHLGAYRVKTSHGDLVFLDTPGHEAFSMMRRRGLGVADIAVLMVAADDGVMPQTVESIKQAQDANIPVVVALNKVDKVDAARLDVVRQQLSKHGLVSEDWGGQTVMVPISAKTGKGVSDLLEMLSLQSELLELQADASLPAEGFLLDVQIQKGLGATAIFLGRHGTLRVGDSFIVGDSSGRIVSMVDSFGKKIDHVLPAIPVKVSGFDSLPRVGDYLQVITAEEYKKIKSGKIKPQESYVNLSSLGDEVENIIFKFDTDSSKEAIIDAISKSSSLKNRINIVFAGVGDITESDIALAETTGSMMCGFSVKLESKAAAVVQKKNIKINIFDIIYKLLEFLEKSLEKNVAKEVVREKTGEAIVKKVFSIKKLGTVAGFQVKQGKIFKSGEVEVWRGSYKIGQGKINSLQKDKKSMKEIGVGFEGALLVDGLDDWQEDDRIVCFVESTKL